jgi:O-methyltransferase/methyltransferase family protein
MSTVPTPEAAQAGPEQATQPTPQAIMELGSAFWGSKTLLSAVELGLFSELAAGPLDAEALRERLGLHPRSTLDFLDALVALGMLEREDGLYRNTPATDLFLDRSKPSYVGGILEMLNERVFAYWGSLTEGLRTGQPQNEAKAGGNLFEAIYSDPEKLGGFVRGMTGTSAGVARAMAAAFPWERYKTVIDVGAAEGCVPVQLALAHDHLSGGGFDLPPVGPFFDDYVAAAGLSDRLRFYRGDFFAEDLPSADVLVMGHILHDWDLDEKRLLLEKAHRALPDGGALIVYDSIIDDERRENAAGLLMSLNMLIETPGGFDYTGADCQGWMRDAGFGETYVQHLVGRDSMVVAIK